MKSAKGVFVAAALSLAIPGVALSQEARELFRLTVPVRTLNDETLSANVIVDRNRKVHSIELAESRKGKGAQCSKCYTTRFGIICEPCPGGKPGVLSTRPPVLIEIQELENDNRISIRATDISDTSLGPRDSLPDISSALQDRAPEYIFDLDR